jgi:hypothetical protein
MMSPEAALTGNDVTGSDRVRVPLRTLPREPLFGVTWRLMTSLPVAMLPPVMHNGTFCTTTIVRKKRGKKSGHAHAITSGHVTSGYIISGHVISSDVTSGNILLHFRSKWSKVTRWSDLGPVEDSVLLHQWESTV